MARIENEDIAQEVVLGVIRKWEYDIIHNKCTPAQIKSVYNALVNNLEMDASLDEMAEHFGQSKSNVSNIISRRFIGKPKRKVLYPLHKIIKIVPRNWLSGKGK